MSLEVFRTAFSKGCGFELSVVERFLERCLRQMRDEYCFSAPVFEYISSGETWDCVFAKFLKLSGQAHSRTERELVTYAGKCLVDAAAEVIPRASRGTEVSFWQRGSIEDRLELIERLVLGLHANSLTGALELDEPYTEDSYRPCERVLPCCFSAPPWKGVNRPNCVGLAMLLAGILARRYGARVHALLPTQTQVCFIMTKRAEIAARFRSLANKGGRKTKQRLTELAEQMESSYLEQFLTTQMLHMALLVETGSNQWAIVDPAWCHVADAPKDWRVSKVDKLLRLAVNTFPGLAVGVRANSVLSGTEEQLTIEGCLCEIEMAEDLGERYSALSRRSFSEIAHALPGTDAEIYLTSMYDEAGLLDDLTDVEQRARVFAKLLAAAVDGQYLKSADEISLTDEQATEVLLDIPLELALLALNSLSYLEQGLFYRSGEVVSLDFAVGAAVCSHLACALDCSEAMQATLARHTNLQWQMLYAAAAADEQEDQATKFVTERAMPVLSQIPPSCRIPGVATVLFNKGDGNVSIG